MLKQKNSIARTTENANNAITFHAFQKILQALPPNGIQILQDMKCTECGIIHNKPYSKPHRSCDKDNTPPKLEGRALYSCDNCQNKTYLPTDVRNGLTQLEPAIIRACKNCNEQATFTRITQGQAW